MLNFCDFMSAASLKLGFLAKPGYDIFGKNKMFVPRIKWQSLRDSAEDIKKAAKSYEEAFNGVKSSIDNNNNFVQVCFARIEEVAMRKYGRSRLWWNAVSLRHYRFSPKQSVQSSIATLMKCFRFVSKCQFHQHRASGAGRPFTTFLYA